MASLADVMDAITNMAFAACYPNGPGTPSATGKVIHIGQGWPLSEDIDAAIAASQTIVSIYSRPGTYVNKPQVMNVGPPQIVVAPVHGLTASVDLSTNELSLTGAANPGEYLSLLVNGLVYSYTATSTTSADDVIAALFALVEGDQPDATASGGVLSMPSATSIVCRIGAKGTIGTKIHTQSQQIQISVWAPTPADRTQVYELVEVAIKTPIRISMPDTSCALIRPRSEEQSDREENKNLYRQNLIIEVQYDTVKLTDAYEVTAVSGTMTWIAGGIQQPPINPTV